MDDLSTGSSDYVANNWITWYLALKGNEYFCEVDEDYILDRFNLTGLNAEVQNYPQALDLITDAPDEAYEDAREHIEAQGRLLYGLVHARYILTTRGLAKMVEKYKRADFGRCPRVLCYGQQLLPVGLSDLPFQKAVKLFCPRCEDIYSPKSSRHGTIDGAFFGSTFPHMLFMVYPHLLPSKQPGAPSPFVLGSSSAQAAAAAARGGDSMDTWGTGDASMAGGNEREPGNSVGALSATGPQGNTAGAGSASATSSSGGGSTVSAASKVERYRPRIFGFPVHEASVLQKWQEKQRDRQIENLERVEREALAAAAAAHGGAGTRGGSGVHSHASAVMGVNNARRAAAQATAAAAQAAATATGFTPTGKSVSAGTGGVGAQQQTPTISPNPAAATAPASASALASPAAIDSTASPKA
ncbi:hypothetical protein K437DRAFT_253684 [Tilletiaria anomala UBC 951]|uniref:Casein kinase II subunit beta n=1 Tax=Tilletiaria anomala (strain ATCC 24038 / CBS 436.72 / UBC 951) TaxID=1037660 RepID=A0A066WQV8_TILAU|nr:uncharacterized protein K437DRAFT_253684 [Tilletiaria anomala UBC 951]KDN53030.1 hypothetical protein K437DRAFT_253684 [Tilletiaria anomala UBC 951]